MSGGQHEAVALGRMASDIAEASYSLRDALNAGESGHRGIGLDVLAEANDILLPARWKIVRATKVEVYR